MRRPTGAGFLVLLVAVSCRSAPAERAIHRPSPSPSVAVEADPEPTVGSEEATLGQEPRTRFAGRVSALPGSLAREMRGTTWKPGCPIPLTDLRLLRFNYWGFDGLVKRGPMVVHQEVAADVLWVFGRLFEARFPIKRVALTREFVPEEFEPRISSNRSVTAAFNCRPVITPLGPGEDFSQHAYGLAVDINPVQNPYVTGDGFVRNRMARPYLDRTKRLTGMIHDGDVVVRSFAAIGWSWGGDWTGGQDYMHFSRTGG
jgi:D-alanyl-D-alanine carboxypeptidase